MFMMNKPCVFAASREDKAVVVLPSCMFQSLSGYELPWKTWKTTAPVSALSISLLYLPQLERLGCGYPARIAIVGVVGEHAWDWVSKQEDLDKQLLWGEN